MTFADLAAGSSVFLDANTFVYHFAPHPIFRAACDQLLDRIECQDLLGYTSTHVLTEVAHRLMTFEAAALPGWPSSKVTQRLKHQPAVIQGLTRFRTAIESILSSRIQVLTIAPPLTALGTIASQQAGLLSNDALIVALMQANGLTDIASHDSDFDRVPGLTRYSPA